MPRRDNDEWDIASSVGLTALGVASARAIESKRSDALVTDPYADALVTAADADVPMPTRLPQPGDEHDAQFTELWSQMATWIGIRTRFSDECCTTGWAEGTTQTVILASGLDARAWRLHWPPESTVFEIDQPKVLAFKTEVAIDEGAEPRCARRPVAIDLREDWPTALLAAGFDRTQPTAWLAEGLLPYLPDEAETRLLTAVHELSAPGSRIALEHARSIQTLLESEHDWLDRMAKQFGIDLPDLFYDNETRPDPDQQLTKLGWQTTVTTGNNLAATYKRSLEGMPISMGEQQRYITASLPR